MIRRLTRHFKPGGFGRAGHAFVVAGLGRCGTGLLVESLVRSGLLKQPFLNRFDDVREFIKGRVAKTHDYPPACLPEHVKVVYLFGNPMNIAISANEKINAWGRKHHMHLASDCFEESTSILYRDTLQLQRQFTAWYCPQGFPFMTMRYESLFEESHRARLAEYLGIPLQLPARRPRSADWLSHPLKDRLLEVYGDLHQTIERVEDVKIWMSAGSDPSNT
jgi:hypothetical protein